MDEVVHLRRREAEFGHGGVPAYEAIGQSLCELVDSVATAEVSKWWSRRIGACARTTDGMAHCTVPRGQRFPPDIAGVGFARMNRSGDHHDDENEPTHAKGIQPGLQREALRQIKPASQATNWLCGLR